MNAPWIAWDGTSLALDPVLAAIAGAALLALAALAVIALIHNARARALQAQASAHMAEELDARIGELARIQAETAGRLQAVGEMLAGRQAELTAAVGERLDAVTTRLGQSLETTTRHTVEGLRHLHERLAVIDSAQKNLTELASQVTSLREVLANKQARGAFGQARMEAIIRDGLPAGSYAFQFTLSNGTRPDCGIFLPDKRPLVIDAKFPLEAVTALREARTEEDRKRAGQRLRQDVGKHIADIAAKYLIPGETQDLALMFVPSESVYAELYDGFDDLVQRAYRARIVLVSPSLLMLAVQVVQQIQKDARMREAASQIQAEVGHLASDLSRLRERVVRLEKHFGQANDDIRQILISADKIDKRAARIEELEFGDGPTDSASAESLAPRPSPAPRLQAGE
ncbi:MAG TPA: DNA recombination protein RmuC [Xanthobacteraceae bacterium]|nr:DNA recombination protein RmuC [Xanthobacteraceae bacterium]